MPFELVKLNAMTGETRTPEYLQINPCGGVPALEDGNFVLAESHAIMSYLARKYEWIDLYPKGLQERAKVW